MSMTLAMAKQALEDGNPVLGCFVRVRVDKGWGGPWGCDRTPAKWVCVWCGYQARGTDDEPDLRFRRHALHQLHAHCDRCGVWVPALADGSPREHPANICPGKTEADRVVPVLPVRRSMLAADAPRGRKLVEVAV
jgi:hypothetical protein